MKKVKKKKYRHLSSEDRFYIEQRLAHGENNAVIAKALNRPESTIGREIKRNSRMVKGKPIYSYLMAHNQAQERQKQAKSGDIKLNTMNVEQKKIFDEELKNKTSPEQLSAVLRNENNFKISTKSIYTFIKKDRVNGGVLYKSLRCKGKKYRSKELKKDVVANKNKQSIETRALKSLLLKEPGHWEVDTIFGLDQKSYLLTIVEMASKYTIIIKLEDKTAETTRKALNDYFSENDMFRVNTITSDNGGEFGDHELIAKTLGAKWYFCHPHCSYERGLNEGTNRLIRDFFPKGTDFRMVSEEEILKVQNILNSRVRKVLGFKRPATVICEMLAA